MTAQPSRHRLVLADARILTRGGTTCLISRRLHVSGTTALVLAARCQGVAS